MLTNLAQTFRDTTGITAFDSFLNLQEKQFDFIEDPDIVIKNIKGCGQTYTLTQKTGTSLYVSSYCEDKSRPNKVTIYGSDFKQIYITQNFNTIIDIQATGSAFPLKIGTNDSRISVYGTPADTWIEDLKPSGRTYFYNGVEGDLTVLRTQKGSKTAVFAPGVSGKLDDKKSAHGCIDIYSSGSIKSSNC